MREPYEDLVLPEPPADRPYVSINMVATIDGKVVVRDDGKEMGELGSEVDHRAMRRIESQCDGTLIGAGTLRGAPPGWCPSTRVRATITASGWVPYDYAFLHACEGTPVVFAASNAVQAPPGVAVRPFHGWAEALSVLRREFDVRRLIVEGGPPLNAALISEGLVDEIFLTVAPKLKLGSGPTLASGDPLPFARMREAELVSCQAVGSEVFLRYRIV
ncbi:MAG: RibD family protein [Fimbriimonadales bacterium]|nr:RibD family protein [Fimbriimonadales bacterium]